ncbi:MAG: hypothetical protein H8D22_02310 [Candidatus Cloacimonetes bacterium]|nr:hypothetical protein [Candidatus Cloacimonadota bacterium]
MKKLIAIVFAILSISNLYSEESWQEQNISNLNYLKPVIISKDDNHMNGYYYNQSTKNNSITLTEPIKRPKDCFFFALDTIVIPGIQIGFGSIKYDSTSTKEKIFVVHANTMLRVSTLGIFTKVNTFIASDRTGFYTSYNIGIDYILVVGVGPGGSDVHSQEFLFPYFSFGLGYSLNIGRSSFLRLSGDIGLKAILASVTLSFVF